MIGEQTAIKAAGVAGGCAGLGRKRMARSRGHGSPIVRRMANSSPLLALLVLCLAGGQPAAAGMAQAPAAADAPAGAASSPRSEAAVGRVVRVRSIAEYTAAVRRLRPGDTVRLANGVWRDFEIVFTGEGRADAPITLEAETPGQVVLSGQSNLRLSGRHLVVRGLRFQDGHSPTTEVIAFRTDSRTLAFNSRVTDVAIIDYNRPDRTQTEIWVALFGRNNRFDHSLLAGKATQGVTLAVRLDAPDSNENNHSIDHNLFGRRPPLGSNGGETIRVGTSHNSLEDSRTRIENNWFEEASGEVEIISIKSGANLVRGNVFRRSQGAVVLRHGNGNLVENNVFYGDGEPGTGGVRVINARQTVRNNWFIGLNGTGSVSALAVMNGVPDSPLNRYHQVVDARIENNTFIAPARITFGAGASEELSLAPRDSIFARNLIIAAPADLFELRAPIGGIGFAGNFLNPAALVPEGAGAGFAPLELPLPQALRVGELPVLDAPAGVGASRFEVVPRTAVGPAWRLERARAAAGGVVSVAPGEDVLDRAVAAAAPGAVLLLGPGHYHQRRLVLVTRPVTLEAADPAQPPQLTFEGSTLFAVRGAGELTLRGLAVSGAQAPDAGGNAVIRAEAVAGPSSYALAIEQCSFSAMTVNRGFAVLRGEPGTFARQVRLVDSSFTGISGPVLDLGAETGGLGIYGAERVEIARSRFADTPAPALVLVRTGRDESTLGPALVLEDNLFRNVGQGAGFLQLIGVQRIVARNNQLVDSQPGSLTIQVGQPTLLEQAASLLRIIDQRPGASAGGRP